MLTAECMSTHLSTMRKFAEILVPVSFEIAELEAKQSGEAIEIEPNRYVQVSPSTVETLELAARLAAGGQILLVHATPDLTHFGVYGGPQGAWFPVDSAGDIHRMTKERSMLVLRTLAERHVKGTSVEYYVAPGPPTTVILHAASKHRPDMIVLAASGRSRIRRAVRGSTANKVVRRADCPVVVVPSPHDRDRYPIGAKI